MDRGGESFLTRNGNFSTNENGFLTTNAGDYVLDANNQPIQLNGNENITVDIYGRIFDEEGNHIAHLQTKSIDNEMANALVKESDSRFILNGIDITSLPEGNAQVHNGILELSNVDMATEMVNLLTNQKMTSASQKIMTVMDSINEKEANSLL